jgi:hypothetical protein
MVEYQDEFGRTRTGLRSEIPFSSSPQPSGNNGDEDGDDPMVEYEDEFGRMRTSRRSEVPRQFLKKTDEPLPEDE